MGKLGDFIPNSVYKRPSYEALITPKAQPLSKEVLKRLGCKYPASDQRKPHIKHGR